MGSNTCDVDVDGWRARRRAPATWRACFGRGSTHVRAQASHQPEEFRQASTEGLDERRNGMDTADDAIEHFIVRMARGCCTVVVVSMGGSSRARQILLPCCLPEQVDACIDSTSDKACLPAWQPIHRTDPPEPAAHGCPSQPLHNVVRSLCPSPLNPSRFGSDPC